MGLSTIYGATYPDGASGILATGNELNGLANGGVAICSGELWSNVQSIPQGSLAGGGWPGYILGELYLDTPPAVYVAPSAIYGWILSAYDGTNYQSILNNMVSGGTTTTPPLPDIADFTWNLNIDSSVRTQRRHVRSSRPAPICAKNYLVLWYYSAGSSPPALAATNNSFVKLYFGTEQFG